MICSACVDVAPVLNDCKFYVTTYTYMNMCTYNKVYAIVTFIKIAIAIIFVCGCKFLHCQWFPALGDNANPIENVLRTNEIEILATRLTIKPQFKYGIFISRCQ